MTKHIRSKQGDGRASQSRIIFSDSGRKLTPRRLDQEATLINIHAFPKHYRQFMLQHNGGTPTPAHFVYRHRGEIRWNWVESLCPITGSDVDPLNLRGANRVLASCALHWGVPYDCIAIGYAAGGNPLLLFDRGPRRNELWIKHWSDVCTDPDPKRGTDPEEGIYHLASSFDAFLTMLCTEDVAMERINKMKS